MSGFDTNRLNEIQLVLDAEVTADRLMGAALQVSQGGVLQEPIVAGRRRLEDVNAKVETDTVFLIASITKPIVSAAVMKLVQDGQVLVDDPVVHYVPEFGADGKENVEVRHLLTHTSGLPDQIPENRAYREGGKPMGDFVSRICELPLMFEAGRKISYQSCGIAILGEICERVTGMDLPGYLHREFFTPLGLTDTSLGIRTRSDRESDVLIAGEGLVHGGAGTDFDWNSDYWRGFAAPWGGLLTTITEMTQLLLLFRNGGTLDGKRILSRSAVATMIQDHTTGMPHLSEVDRMRQRWGYGWRLSGPSANVFGDLVSADTFGHGGATGTLAWVDPERDLTCALFTNDPEAAGSLRGRISNMVVAALA